ncbi:unnamed protein product [Echinostoma caproni]|uniref:MHC_I-like_Ag-recog domain-containing protein n=1 Tax=Echinostoma caproni TaxID=27848 RepID=A0A183AC31_9TREM|nr:unnamed protein product [Echinostoma caproni]
MIHICLHRALQHLSSSSCFSLSDNAVGSETFEQNVAQVNGYSIMLARCDGGRSNAVWEIIRSDETWLYSFDREKKQKLAQWTPVGEAPIQKFRSEHSKAKQMMAVCMTKVVHVAAVALVQQSTVTGA